MTKRYQVPILNARSKRYLVPLWRKKPLDPLDQTVSFENILLMNEQPFILLDSTEFYLATSISVGRPLLIADTTSANTAKTASKMITTNAFDQAEPI